MILKNIKNDVLYEDSSRSAALTLRSAIYDGVSLDFVDLRRMNLMGVDLDGVSMKGASLWGGKLIGS